MKVNGNIHDSFMRQCIVLARKGSRVVSPNPMVGALLVRNGTVVSQGYHRQFGGPHAEVECLKRYRGSCEGTTLYVNLEPCAHFGKTAPCTNLVIDAGIRHVVVGTIDPNPLVSGRGIQALREAGVRVTIPVAEKECQVLNRQFFHHIRSKRPYVNVKIAATLDGKISGGGRHHGWISGASARRLVHQWRATHDAVLVGAGTIRADNPLFTVRHVKGIHPDVAILDGSLSLRPNHNVFTANLKRRVLLFCKAQAAIKNERVVAAFGTNGVHVIPMDGENATMDMEAVLSLLYREHIGSVLVEGGRQVFTQFVSTGLWNELNMFIAPTIYGNGLGVSQNLTKRWIPHENAKLTIRRIANDLLVSFT